MSVGDLSETDTYGDLDSAHEPPDPVLPEGSVIDGKYEIKKLLGRGGSGSVYEAQHAMIGHRVAIKVVHSSEMRRQVSLARFRREAKICGAIRHPHVGQIYDVGAFEDGTPFMVMELHEGRSLGNILDESILPIAVIIEVARQLLAGLAAVHEAGAIHRDVKPDNAMIVRASSGDLVVKLVDFGISKIVRADIRERALTKKDIIVGSPDYMAPEQLRGQEVDVRTDLYAVGVLLYEAVTGCVPFNAGNLADLMIAIMCDPLTPPSQLRTDCPPELEHLILKAMARDPADRFQTAGEMSRQLAHVQRTVRYASDPGLSRLQEPMPPRDAATRRTHGVQPKVPLPEQPKTSISDNPTITARRPTRWRALRWVVLAASVTAAVAFALIRTRDVDSPPEKRSASSAERAAGTRTGSSNAPSPERGTNAGASASSPSSTSAPRPADAPTAGAPVVEGDGPEPQPARARPPSQRDTPREAEGKRQPAPDDGKPGEPSIRALLDEAASAFVLGQTPRARSIYQRIVERQPLQADAWRGLALTASRMGQRSDAQRAFERYLALRPRAPDAERIRQQLDKLR